MADEQSKKVIDIRGNPRDRLTQFIKELVAKQVGDSIGSNQVPEEGEWKKTQLTTNKLIVPPYDPSKLCRIVENSSILPQCVDAMVLNTDGFGYQLFYTGPSELEDSEQVATEKKRLTSFFDQVNEKQSFTTVRREMREDYHKTGNGYLEIIRFQDESIALIYAMDSRNMRLQAIQTEPVETTVLIDRGEDKMKEIKVQLRFRKFAMKVGPSKLKWFKQYGDPRKMNRDTGKYENEEGYKPDAEASEVLHFKVGNDTYGIPQWVGNMLTAMGMNSSDFVNFDLFENQVVPPMAVLVSGGVLTQQSVDDIINIMVQKKGVENFNKVLVLEAQTDGTLTDKSQVKIELKELSTARKEDAMFTNYVDKGEHRIRGSFRLPPLYLGRADTYSKSTADSSKMIAEEQVFVPERNLFDEIINMTIMRDLNAQYHSFKSKGPRLITGEQIVEGFREFGKLGVFTINQGIRLANRTLGLDLTEYKQPWADFPIAIVMEFARLGLLSNVEELITSVGDVKQLLKGIDDPEEALKIYQGLSQLREGLAKMLKERTDKEEVAEKMIRLNELESLAAAEATE